MRLMVISLAILVALSAPVLAMHDGPSMRGVMQAAEKESADPIIRAAPAAIPRTGGAELNLPPEAAVALAAAMLIAVVAAIVVVTRAQRDVPFT